MTKTATYAALLGGGLLVAAALLFFTPWLGSAMAPRWLGVYGLALAGLVGVALSARPKIDVIDLLAAAFLGWAALSLLWSGDPKAGILQWQHMAALFAVAMVFRHTRSIDAILLPTLVAAALGGIVLFVVWPQFHGGFGNPNFAAETMVLLLPLLALLPSKNKGELFGWLILVAIAGVLIYLFFYNASNVQHLAFLAWLAAVGVALARNRSSRPLLAMLVAAMVIGVGIGWWLGMTDQIVVSLTRRAEIWINTVTLIGQHPLIGSGLGSFDYALPRSAHVALLGQTFLENPTDFMGAAHNEYLQLVAELGAIGFVLAAGLGWAVSRGTWGPSRRAGAWCLLTVAAISLVGFPLQNPASAVLVAISAGLLARRRVRWKAPAVRLLSWLAMPAAVSLYLYSAAVVEMATVYRYIHVEPVRALQANLRALDIYPLSPWLRVQSMLTLRAVVQRYKEHVDLSPSAADRIFQIATSAIPEQPGVLLSRVEYMINSGRYIEKEEMERLFDVLHRVGPLYPQVVALESVYAVLTEDAPRAEKAVRATMAMPGGPELFETMGFLRREEPPS